MVVTKPRTACDAQPLNHFTQTAVISQKLSSSFSETISLTAVKRSLRKARNALMLERN
jgi:hypothetical protein